MGKLRIGLLGQTDPPIGQALSTCPPPHLALSTQWPGPLLQLDKGGDGRSSQACRCRAHKGQKVSFGERLERPLTDAGGQPVSSASPFALLAADGWPPTLEPHRGHVLRLTDSLGPEFGRAPQETPRLCSTGSGPRRGGRWVGRPGLRPFQAAAPNRGSPEGAPKGAGRREGLLQPSTPP